MLGTRSAASIAQEVGVHRANVLRHKRAHLAAAVVATVEKDAGVRNLDVLEELRGLFQRMKRHLGDAERTRNLAAIKLIGSEVRAALELFAKLAALAAAARPVLPPRITVDVSEGPPPELPSVAESLRAIVAEGPEEEPTEDDPDRKPALTAAVQPDALAQRRERESREVEHRLSGPGCPCGECAREDHPERSRWAGF